MRTTARGLGLLLYCITLVGCSGNDLPEYVKLGDLRILALVVDTPEVGTGATVTLTPVLSDLNGAGRALTYSAAACPDPGVAYGAVPTCTGSSTKVSLATGQSVTGLSGPNYTGAVTSTLSISIPASIFDQRSSLEKANGVSYLVTYQVTASDGTSVSAFKRILVSTKGSSERNQNPLLTSVLAGGSAFGSLPTRTETLSVTFGAGTPETYFEVQADGSIAAKEESLLTTWFISDGSVDQFRTVGAGEVQYTPPAVQPTGRNVVFVIVIRDGRGGIAYQVLNF